MLDSLVRGLYKRLEKQIANLKDLFLTSEDSMKRDVESFKSDNDSFKLEIKSELETHKQDTENPHTVTKEQVGLGDVLNIEQASKTEFNKHQNDSDIHVKKGQKETWDNKETVEGSQEKSDLALVHSKEYTDEHELKTNLHTQPGEKDKWNGYESLIDTLASTLNVVQKYRLTQDDGKSQPLSNGTDVLTLSPGIYTGQSLVNAPSADDPFLLIINSKDNSNKSILAISLKNNETWLFSKFQNVNSTWNKVVSSKDMNVVWVNTTLIVGTTNPQYPLRHRYIPVSKTLEIQGTFTAPLGATIAKLSYFPVQNIDFTGVTVGSYGQARMTLTTTGDLIYSGLFSKDDSKVERVSLNETIPLS
ncbi:hypothetical protein RFW13_17240 [Bacillus pumilus]|uniref:hypothetical protein n=1 Tax=Bacillus pumilus TaxID=1408 RepID=UPI00281452AE|nr:hypothetical protein [Bacillus pumilus]MDR0123173.1 hypothetical protein [Bacillus pumilus]